MLFPVPVSAGCEYTMLGGSGCFRLRSISIDAEGFEGAGEGVEVVGAAEARLLSILLDDWMALDLKALIWFCRYDIMKGDQHSSLQLNASYLLGLVGW